MKKLFMMAMMGWYVSGTAQDAGFRIQGIGSVSVPVTADKMTNLVFPEKVQTGVKVSRDVLVQKVRGVENVIELKAVRRGFTPTNLSVYGRDGRLYSFTLRYVEDTAVLNYRVVATNGVEGAGLLSGGEVQLTGLPASETRLREDADALIRVKPHLNKCMRVEGVRLRLTGVYLRDTLEWLVFTVAAKRGLPYRPAPMRFYQQDAREIRRTASQEVELEPVYAGDWANVDGSMRVAVGFEPFTVRRGRRLVCEVVGKDGRVVEVKVKGRVLLRARTLSER